MHRQTLIHDSDAHSLAIAGEHIALAPDLASLLNPEVDLKVKHGVIALLKHLAQAPGNRVVLGKANIIQRLSTSAVFGEKADIVDVVQLSAIGVAKHLCNGNCKSPPHAGVRNSPVDATLQWRIPCHSWSPIPKHLYSQQHCLKLSH